MMKNNFFGKIKGHIMPKDVGVIIAIVMTIFFLWVSNRPPSEEFIKGQQELLKIKESITGDFLMRCRFETHRCNFNPENTDMKELAGYIRDASPVYATGHNVPYAYISIIESRDDDYFKMNISFYNLLYVKGVAILECDFYKNGKNIAGKAFSSSELTEWAWKEFPEVFDKIQKDNEKHFYIDMDK